MKYTFSDNDSFDEINVEEIESIKLPAILVTDFDETSTSKIYEESSGVKKMNQDQPSTSIKRGWEEENETADISSTMTACLPPNISNIHEEIKKYAKLNTLNIIISCLFIPENVARLYSIYFSLKCKEFGPLDDKVCIFQFVFIVLYPYFVKKKLETFK